MSSPDIQPVICNPTGTIRYHHAEHGPSLCGHSVLLPTLQPVPVLLPLSLSHQACSRGLSMWRKGRCRLPVSYRSKEGARETWPCLSSEPWEEAVGRVWWRTTQNFPRLNFPEGINSYSNSYSNCYVPPSPTIIFVL